MFKIFLSVERDFIVNSDTGKTMDMIKAVGHLGRRNVARYYQSNADIDCIKKDIKGLLLDPDFFEKRTKRAFEEWKEIENLLPKV